MASSIVGVRLPTFEANYSPRFRFGRRTAIGLGIILIALMVATLAVKSGVTVAARGVSLAVPNRVETFGLTATCEAGRIILRWDQQAEAIKMASRAVLVIAEAGRRESVELDLNVLRTKKLAYSPISNDVTFQITVADLDWNHAVTESVRVLGPGLGAVSAAI